MLQIRRRQKQTLLMEIHGIDGATTHSDHRSRRTGLYRPNELEIWPRDLGALLQTTGIEPLQLDLTTPALLLRHLRPASPPGRARDRPGALKKPLKGL